MGFFKTRETVKVAECVSIEVDYTSAEFKEFQKNYNSGFNVCAAYSAAKVRQKKDELAAKGIHADRNGILYER